MKIFNIQMAGAEVKLNQCIVTEEKRKINKTKERANEKARQCPGQRVKHGHKKCRQL